MNNVYGIILRNIVEKYDTTKNEYVLEEPFTTRFIPILFSFYYLHTGLYFKK